MAHYKLLLDDNFGEDFSLIAVHCSEEAYKLAYLLNRHLSLRLRRCDADLDYSTDGIEVSFPLFDFEDPLLYTKYNLVANKCKSKAAAQPSGGLFEADTSEKTVTTYLLPEFRQADFFLKISIDFGAVPLKKVSLAINDITQVISAYPVAAEKIKSKNNLIFD